MDTKTTLPSADLGSETKTLDRVVIRFAGDSGDGMQLTGNQFTNTTAVLGNDLSTLPTSPPRSAPPRTLPGVSGFQIHFSSADVFTPGDEPDVLVAMNPAALRQHRRPQSGRHPDREHRFVPPPRSRESRLQDDPLEDGSLAKFRVFPVELAAHQGRAQGDRLNAKESRPLQELLRPLG
jgi:2-oxoglutarate ferredoxin oxidoreductase subunit alpha